MNKLVQDMAGFLAIGYVTRAANLLGVDTFRLQDYFDQARQVARQRDQLKRMFPGNDAAYDLQFREVVEDLATRALAELGFADCPHL